VASLDLSICIASYNTRDITLRTLAAAKAQASGISSEIIVVDNASSDGSADLIRAKWPGIHLVENRKNRYFSVSYNQAFGSSSGRFILALNSDVELLDNALETMLACLETDDSVGAVTGRLFSTDGRLQRTAARFASYPYLVLEYGLPGFVFRGARDAHRRERMYHNWQRDQVKQIDVAPGSFLMLRSELITEIGGFDERLKLYFTDDDLCVRVAEAGSRILYLPAARAIHMGGASASQNPGLSRQIFFSDLQAYAKKHFGIGPARILGFLTRPTLLGLTLAGLSRELRDRFR
jgi:GT2 family glycosyltransferase